MRKELRYLSFLLSFLIFLTSIYADKAEYVVITGYVYDTSVNYLKNARVEIRNISGKDDKTPKSYIVTYTNKKGKWKEKVPFSKLIMIKTYSNGFVQDKSVINMEMERSLNNSIIVVRSRMKRGIKQIEWDSFEHQMMYIRGEYQKEIELLSNSPETKNMEDYINKKIAKFSRKDAFAFAGYVSFLRGALENSKKYFDKAGSKIWFNLMGKKYLDEGKYGNSLNYYLKGVITRGRAYDLAKLAEKFEKEEEKNLKSKCYKAAMEDFNRIIIDFRYKWSEDLLRMRNECSQHLTTDNKEENTKELKDILIKAGEYCKKLKKSAIYYYCTEEKIDKVVLVEDLYDALENPEKYYGHYKPAKLKGIKIKDKYIYDLQFILNENGVVEEARKLVKEYPDLKRTPLPVLSYKVVRPLYGPNTLIGFGWQDNFNYKISGRELLYGSETAIIEAFPKWSSFLNQMYGRLWVNIKDGSILKIEWKHQNLHRNDLRIRGLILNSIPTMTFISIYGKTVSGLRFPSKYNIIEYYENSKGDNFTRLNITGIYKDYTFFGVDIDDVKVKQ